MYDLRLADEAVNAAEYISANEGTDVEISGADGSRLLYVGGEDVTPAWWAAPMPQMQPGKPASNLDMTPKEVRLGRWHEEAEEFISSRSLSIREFLDLHRLAISRR
jgi:hypothetical protein